MYIPNAPDYCIYRMIQNSLVMELLDFGRKRQRYNKKETFVAFGIVLWLVNGQI